MNRVVSPEWLDELPAADASAIGSRRDLQRLNYLMGHVGIMAGCLTGSGQLGSIRRLVELGAGDGAFLLRVARLLAPQWPGVKVVLVDRQSSVPVETRNEMEKLGWPVETATADIFEWLAQTKPDGGTVMMSNLFLHHFPEEPLRALLTQAALKTDLFVACEPRRSGFALTASRLLGLIGCNAVTRHDAVGSVRAGFAGRELSKVWPADPRWEVKEGKAGLFSHFFVARLRSTVPAGANGISGAERIKQC